MNPDRWRRVEALCFDALELAGGERAAFLDRECQGDAELRREVESLAAEIDRNPGYLERPLLALDAVSLAAFEPSEAPEPIPATIGPYRVVSPIGRGGMGDVYLATRESDDIHQSVAVKVIRGASTGDVMARFRLERRMLASLHHPNIASLLDAGATPDGRPYFVMEYIEGTPLDAYCDANRPSLAARLDLFRIICGAVHHAHQNLIVHRDLKPRNILVTRDGVPKLLDFGIAKVLAGADTLGVSVETRTNVRLLTPEYAAPEQLTGGPVTTATDGYGLGVLLYELLTGRHPHVAAGDSYRDLERKILETDPTRPSAVVTDGDTRRQLAGDLDTIALKALAKEPERRYPSALALADDVERYQRGLPVRARPDTIRYRVRKFVARNAVSVGAAAVTVVALVVTTAVTLVQSARVRAESVRVTRERDKALEVRGFLMEMFGATGANQATGDTVSVRQLLDIQAARLDTGYRDQPELRAEIMEVLADGYDRLGLYRTAEPLAASALAIRRSLHRDDHPDLAGAINLLGWIRYEVGRRDSAEPLLREAIAMRQRLGPRHRADLARSQNDLGVLLNDAQRYPEAESVLVAALATRREVHGDDHRAVGITANNLAAAQYFQANLPAATETQALALRSLERSVGREHQRTIVALGNLAAFKRARGDVAGAEADYRDLAARQARLQGPNHPVTLRTAGALAAVVFDRGLLEGNAALVAEADSLFGEVVAGLEGALGPAHPQVATYLDRRAGVVLERGRHREALSLAHQAIRRFTASLGDTAQSTLAARGRSAHILWRLGDRRGAIAEQAAVVDRFALRKVSPNLELARAQSALCEFLVDSGESAEGARATCRRAEAIFAGAPPTWRRNLAQVRLRLAQAERRLGNGAAADSLVALVAAVDTALLSPRDRRLLDSLRGR
jgi:serine/threonine-protein kinase